jgi:hypothetical protein
VLGGVELARLGDGQAGCGQKDEPGEKANHLSDLFR